MKIDISIIKAYADAIRAACGDDEQTYLDTLDGETDVVDLIDMALSNMRDDEALSEAIKAQTKALRDRQARIEMRAEAHRKTILSLMQAASIRKLERPAATVSLRPGTPSVKIVDEAEIPSQLMRVKTTKEPDKAAIKAALQAGEIIPGAALDPGVETISVRVA